MARTMIPKMTPEYLREREEHDLHDTKLMLWARGDLLPYGNCTRAELLGFCLARNIRIPNEDNKALKRNLIPALEHADENIRFRFFFVLPAELRLLIVEEADMEYEEVEKAMEGEVEAE
ncbi:hypothetical protein LTR10_004466 [Elasticomyces elasticus]|nr:hypothetical protein LTR10_004466 [Elasticomyces elasticus]KAK4976785.1 hypothetical protein LTR42_002830 [Elasticomyces elasticus]